MSRWNFSGAYFTTVADAFVAAPFVSLGDMAYEEGVRSEKRNTGKKELSM